MIRRAAILLLTAALLLPAAGVDARARSARGERGLPRLTPAGPDALTEALDNGGLTAAEYALHRARAFFRLGAVRDEFGDVARQDPHAATLMLRDLALRASFLEGEERAMAEDILARPDDSSGGIAGTGWSRSATKATPLCGPHVCVHYVTNTKDSATRAWADETLATFEFVWEREVRQLGFRAPKPDGTKGGDGRLDVYIDNLDEIDLLYGYCATGIFSPPPWDQPVYCAVDNDYATFEALGQGDARSLLQVTSAHEFNHASQYAYDAGEDAWFQEATATWMEDQVYDAINDNRQYIRNSISRPRVPADSWEGTNGAPGLFQYGQWVWMQYYAQRHGPDIVRRFWERADATGTAPDDFSVEAMTNALAPASFATSFADFAAVNSVPNTFYEEASEDPAFYRPRPRFVSHTLGTSVTGTLENVDHLSSRQIGFQPVAGAVADQPVTVAVNLTDAQTGARATLVSIPKDGSGPAFQPMTIDSTGAGTVTTPFGNMKEVVLVLSNGSNRYTGCAKFFNGDYTCNGRPVDDNQAYTYAAAIGTTAPTPPTPPEGDTTPPRIRNLRAKPNPVVRGRTTTIIFSINEAATVRIKVLKNGKLIVGGASEFGAETIRIPWRTRRSDRAGRYVIKVRATDDSGNTSRSRTSVRLK